MLTGQEQKRKTDAQAHHIRPAGAEHIILPLLDRNDYDVARLVRGRLLGYDSMFRVIGDCG